MSDRSTAYSSAQKRSTLKNFQAYSVMLEPKHLQWIEDFARRGNMPKAAAIREMIATGLPLAEAMRPAQHMAYEKLVDPKRVHMRLPLDLNVELRERQAELGLRLGEIVRMCLEMSRS